MPFSHLGRELIKSVRWLAFRRLPLVRRNFQVKIPAGRAVVVATLFTVAVLAVWPTVVQTSAPVHAQGYFHSSMRPSDTTGSISGAVRDNVTFARLANVAVSAVDPPNGGGATTDSQGNYIIAGLAPGTYSVTATLTGFTPAIATVIVGSGNVLLDLYLNTLTPTITPTPEPGFVTGVVRDDLTSPSYMGRFRLPPRLRR